MKHKIIISTRGKVFKKRSYKVLPSLPYQGIARRALSSVINYDRKIKRRRFSVIDRYTQKAKQQIMSQEDNNILNALHKK